MMAVVQSGRSDSSIPGDGTATVAANGIPEIWENLYGGSLNPAGDNDTGPAANRRRATASPHSTSTGGRWSAASTSGWTRS